MPPYLWDEERLIWCWIIKPRYCPKVKDKKCPRELRRRKILSCDIPEKSTEDKFDQRTVCVTHTPLSCRQNWGRERKDWLRISAYLKRKSVFFYYYSKFKNVTCLIFFQFYLILISSKSVLFFGKRKQGTWDNEQPSSWSVDPQLMFEN